MAADPVWEMTSQTWTSRAEDRDTSEVQVTSRHLSDEQQSASAWMLVNELACQKRASARWLVLAGETLLEVQQRLLKEREMKIRSALEKLRKKRHLLRAQRKHKEFPIVSVLGYTNCGERVETVLAQLLSIQGFSMTTLNTILLFSFPSSAQEKRLWSKRWLVTVVFNPETSFSPPWMSPFMQASCPVTWRFCTWTPSASCRSCRTSSLTPSLPPWKISNTQYVSDAGVLDETQAIWSLVFQSAVVDSALIFLVPPGSVGPRQRHQSSRDGESEGERTECPQEPANPWQAVELHDRSPQ